MPYIHPISALLSPAWKRCIIQKNHKLCHELALHSNLVATQTIEKVTNSCIFPSVMHTPALTGCISIYLSGLNCPFSKPVSSAAEIPSRPPTQKAAGGRAQSRQAILTIQKVLYSTQD